MATALPPIRGRHSGSPVPRQVRDAQAMRSLWLRAEQRANRWPRLGFPRSALRANR